MSDPLEVKPRYVEQDTAEGVFVIPAPVEKPAPRGIFAAIYDHKIAILVIILSVIAIIVAIYFIYKKYSEPLPLDQKQPTQQKQSTQPTQPTQPSAPTNTPTANVPTANVSTANGAGNGAEHIEVIQPHHTQSKGTLLRFLHIARMATVDSPAADVPTIVEIEEVHPTIETGPVMNDISANIDTDISSIINADKDTPSDSEVISAANIVSDSQSAGESRIAESSSDADTGPDGKCKAVLSSGKLCRNRARPNGKCAKHGGI